MKMNVPKFEDQMLQNSIDFEENDYIDYIDIIIIDIIFRDMGKV